MSRVWPALALSLLTSACRTSPAPRFYALSSVPAPAAPASAAADAPIVAVGPVRIPDYADRPELVTAVGSNEAAVRDFDRWQGDLGKDLSRALVQSLAEALPAGKFTVVQWDPAAFADKLPARRAAVTVTRFDLSTGPGAAALLEAEWTLYGADGKTLFVKKASKTSPAQGKEIKDLVVAMSRCVAELGDEIARDLGR